MATAFPSSAPESVTVGVERCYEQLIPIRCEPMNATVHSFKRRSPSQVLPATAVW